MPATAILLYGANDNALLSHRIDNTFPPREYIRQVYEHLAYFYQLATGDGYGITREFNIDLFCQRFHHFPIRVHSALQILQRAGYIDYDAAPDQNARVHFMLERHELDRLQHLSDIEDRVIVTLLRSYGGLFSDVCYIDEGLIAQLCGIKSTMLHEVLKTLAQKHIIQYIPRRNVPTIQYLQRREDPEHVVIPRSVYEDRLEQYRQRIHAMQRYAQDQLHCRSRLLLEYFGEKHTHDCGQCDVCQEQQEPPCTDDCSQAIIALLSDGKQHQMTELRSLPFPYESISKALSHLMAEERIIQQDGVILRG